MAELLDAKSLKLYKEVFDLLCVVRGFPAGGHVCSQTVTPVWRPLRSDYNANGSLNVRELSTILRALGQNVTEAEVGDLLSEVVRRDLAPALSLALTRPPAAAAGFVGERVSRL